VTKLALAIDFEGPIAASSDHTLWSPLENVEGVVFDRTVSVQGEEAIVFVQTAKAVTTTIT